jgi:hypothetical protein
VQLSFRPRHGARDQGWRNAGDCRTLLMEEVFGVKQGSGTVVTSESSAADRWLV